MYNIAEYVKNKNMYIKRIVILGCATLDSNRYQRPKTHEEILQVGPEITIDLVDQQFEVTVKHLDSDIEINKLYLKVFPMSAESYFNRLPVDLCETIVIYDFTGNTTRNELSKMINKDMNLMHRNIIYYPMGCISIWNSDLLNPEYIESNPPYNKFINTIDEVVHYTQYSFNYKNSYNKVLFVNEMYEFTNNIHTLCSFIKDKYYTTPVPKWCEQNAFIPIHVDNNNLNIIIKKLVKWYCINSGALTLEINTEKKTIDALDTIRKFKLK